MLSKTVSNIAIFILILILFGHLTTPLSAQQGLVGDYYNGTNFQDKIMTRTDARIDFVWDNVPPVRGMNAHDFSIRWKSKIKAPKTGTYLFRAHVDDGIRVKVNGKLVINAWSLNDSERFSGSIELQAGKLYTLEVEYFNAILEGEIQLYWQLPDQRSDQIIGSEYFFSPNTPDPVAPAPKPQAPAPKPKPKAATPKPKAPAPKPVVVSRDTLEKYTPRNVQFEKSKSILLTDAYPELDHLAGFLLRNPKLRLKIEGHTDKVGNAAKNLQLSKERAAAVSAYLTQKGVAAERIEANGYGDTRPLSIEQASVNPKNRRVEFIIY